MRRLRPVLVLLAAVALVGVCRTATAGEHKIVLTEHVNRRWTNELLSYPFEAPEGACHAGSVRLDGPKGPMPVQLSDIEYWPKSRTVKSAKLWLVADLAPLASNTYTVRYGTPAAKGPEGDLKVAATAKQVEMTTSRFGARLRLGAEKYRTGRASAKVPGPVEALRLADGTWFGGSRLYGKTKLTGWSGKLTGAGPVFGQVEYVYQYEGGNTLKLTARLYEGAAGLYWEAHVPEDQPEDGLDIALSKGLPPLTLLVQYEAYSDRPQLKDKKKWSWVEIPLADYQGKDGLVTRLSPWADWWSTWTQTTVRLRLGKGERELHLTSHDPGAWVKPAKPGTMAGWGAWQHKMILVNRGTDGMVFVRVNNAAGARKWSIEDREPAYAEARRMSRAQVKAEWPPLNEVKDWILDWPSKGQTYPHLFVSRDDLLAAWKHTKPDPDILKTAAYIAKEEIRPTPSYKDAQAMQAFITTKGDAAMAKKVKLVQRARQHMGALGDFDKMRSTQTATALYDLVMGADLVTEAEKKLFRSQMAFLCYILERPSTWNIERGFRSYNPNMSLSYLLARGIAACAIPDHPKAREWVAPGLSRAEKWLEEVGPEGEWYESAHYSHVSIFAMTSFALAVKRAGFQDLFLNENLKKWAMWLAQIYTPRDPMEGRHNRRAGPPIGRATAGVAWGLFGLMAKATAETDPLYSKQMQWAWSQCDYNTNTANHLGGFEPIYMDRSLPMQKPDWGSKLFPKMGPLFRNGIGDKHENYLIAHGVKGAGVRPSEYGCIAMWFARGVPIAGSFPGGYKERHQLMISRVSPIISWKEGQTWSDRQFGCNTEARIAAFSALPRQDYCTATYKYKGWRGGRYGTPKDPVNWPPVAGKATFPMTWVRRMLYVQDDKPDGPNYLVLRDSVAGGGSLWQMWTASEKIGTPEQVRDLKAFLKDKPGKKPVAAHKLPAGDRFTAVGRFNVDVEYYVAAPSDTERWTMRMVQRYVDYGVVGDDSRDLMQLRLKGDGDYFVAMFPRFRKEAAPQFSALGDGTVIQVTGTFGTDYCFLPPAKAEATAGKAYFRGEAGSVQDRGNVVVLATGAAGEVRYDKLGLSAPQAASVRASAAQLVVSLPPAHKKGGQVTLRVAGRWRPAAGQTGVKATVAEGGYVLVLAPGTVQAVLEQVNPSR